MYKEIKLSASIMCADWLDLKNQLTELEQNNIDYIHYDVIDGRYAPDFTMGSAIIELIKKSTKLINIPNIKTNHQKISWLDHKKF